MSEKVAIYIRVSTDKQAETGTSIEIQVEALERYCRERGLQIYDKYIDDGYSGENLNRPAFQRLKRDIEAGHISTVLVHKTDRFGRNIIDAVIVVLREFVEKGVSFASITEPYDTSTPQGRMFFIDMAKYADHEREMIRQRTVAGKRRKVKEGKWMGSSAHYAYDIDENKKLVVNERRSRIFRQMVSWLLDGRSCRWIARKLNDDGVPTWKKEKGWKIKKSVHFWRAEPIREMLINPVITGKTKFWGIDFEAPAIITPEEYQQIKNQLKRNRTYSERNTKHFYLLSGLLYCKRCGSRLYGHKKKPRRGRKNWDMAYSCPSGRYIQDIPSCGLRRINLSRIESFVWNTVKDLVLDSEKLRNRIEARHVELYANDAFNEDKIREYDKQAEALEEEKSRLLSLYSRSEIYTIDELDMKAKEIQDKIDAARAEQSKFITSRERLLAQKAQINQADAYFKSIRERLDDFNDEERKKLVSLLCSRIVVDWDEERFTHTLEIEGVIPAFDNKENGGERREHPQQKKPSVTVTEPSKSRSPGGIT